MPASNAAFETMVEGLLNNASADTGEGSMELAAKLLQLAPAFAQVSDYANTLSETMKRLQSDTADLEIELLRAQGNTAGADAAQRTLDIKDLTEAEIAIYDYNNSLRLQIQSISDAAEAIKGLKVETQSLKYSYCEHRAILQVLTLLSVLLILQVTMLPLLQSMTTMLLSESRLKNLRKRLLTNLAICWSWVSM